MIRFPLLISLMLTVIAGEMRGQELTAPARALQAIEVPLDAVDQWPSFSEQMIAVPRTEFQRRWKKAQPRPQHPPTITIETAHLEATLTGSVLTGGIATFQLRRSGTSADWLVIPSCNLAINSLTADGSPHPVIWGTAEDGQLWVRVEPGIESLTASWSLEGKVTAHVTTFDLEIPSTLSTVLCVNKAPEVQLTSSSGLVRLPSQEPSGPMQRWECLAGTQSHIRLLARTSSATPGTPMVAYRRQLTAAIREDHLRFEVVFYPEVLGGTVDSLEFTLPKQVDLYSITGGGDNQLVWFTLPSDGPRRIVRVRLLDRQGGVLRQIRLEGIATQRPGSVTTLPAIDLHQGIFQTGTAQVSVMRPLQVVALRTTGCRQDAPLVSSPEGETYQFQQTVAASQITMEVRRPKSTLAAQVLSTLECDAEEFLWNNEIQWSSSSGSAFELTARIPTGWEVTDVSSPQENSSAARIGWETTEDIEGQTKVSIELLEPLTPDRPQRLRLQARRKGQTNSREFACPILQPMDCQSVTIATRVGSGTTFDVCADTNSPAEEIRPESLPPVWKNLTTWPEWSRSSEGSVRWFRSVDAGTAPKLTLYPRLKPVEGQIEVLVEPAGALLSESFELRLKCSPTIPLERLLVFLTEPGSDITWQVDQPAHWDVVAARIPTAHNPQPGYPAMGELWELRFPPSRTSELLIKGTRVRPLKVPVHGPLLFLPQGKSVTSTITVDLKEAPTVQTVTRGMTDAPSLTPHQPAGAASKHGQRQAWRYSRFEDELALVSRRANLQPVPCIAKSVIRSQLSIGSQGYDLHQAEINLSASQKPVRLKFNQSLDLLQATVDGFPQKILDEDELVIAPNQGNEQNRTVVLKFTTTQTPGYFRTRYQVPHPLSDDVVWQSIQWEFAVPPAARIFSEPAGYRLSTRPAQAHLLHRWIGPLARTSSSGIFRPWDPASWAQLISRNEPVPPTSTSLQDEFSAPRNWQTYVAYAPAPDFPLMLDLWNQTHLELLAWIMLLAVLTLGCLLRILRKQQQKRHRWRTLWLASWMGISLAVDSAYAEIVGGVIAGTVLAWMIPGRWLRWKLSSPTATPQVPLGSTQSFTLPRSAVTGATCLLLVIGWTSRIFSEPPLPDLQQIVLVPVTADGRPSDVVYLTPETWKWLEEVSQAEPVRQPRWLIQAADYTATIEAGQRVVMQANLTVLDLADDGAFELPLRYSTLGSTAAYRCTVDQQPATITPLTQGPGFQVRWERPAEPVSAISAAPIQLRKIHLAWQHAWQRESGLAVFLLRIPKSPWNNLELRGLPQPLMTTDGGVTRLEPSDLQNIIDERGMSRQIFGASDSVRMAWREMGPSAEPIEVQVNSLEAWSLWSGYVDVRSRTILQPRTGATRRMYVRLPAGSIIRRWSTSLPAEFQAASPSDPEGWSLLEFVEPLTESATIDLEFVTPLDVFPGEFRWTGVTWKALPGTRIQPGRRLWALSAPDEIRLQPHSLEDSGLIPVDLVTSRTGYGDLFSDRSPQSLYEVGAATSVIFQASLAAPVRQLLLWEQSAAVGTNPLKWTIDGELTVSGLPVYQHVLNVDRRLNIESISVKEQGTERLVRWSESRSTAGPGSSRITLFLSTPAVETQRIHVEASVPLTAATSIPLPNVRCEEALFAGGRLVLKTPKRVEMFLAGTRGLRELTTDDNSSNAENVRIFDQTDPDWRATIRVLSPREARAARGVHLISSDDAQSLQVTSVWRLPLLRLNEPATIILPPPWDLSTDSTVTGGTLDVVRSSDGTWNAVVMADGSAEDVVAVLRAKCQRSSIRDEGLPLPQAIGEIATGSTQTAGEWTRLPQSPLISTATPHVSSNPPVDWGTGVWQEPTLAENDRLQWFELKPEQTQIIIATDQTASAATAVEWIEHRLWKSESNGTFGETNIRFSRPTNLVTVRFAGDLSFLAATVSGQVCPTRTEDDRKILISAPDGRPFYHFQMLWHEKPNGPLSPLGTSEANWPEILHAEVDQQAITLLPVSGQRLQGTTGWQQGDWVDRWLLRLEILGDNLASASDDHREELRREFLADYQSAVMQFGASATALKGDDRQRHLRWRSIIDRVNQWQRPEDLTKLGNATVTLDDALMNHPDSVFGMVPGMVHTAYFWRVDSRWIRGLASILIILAIWPLLGLLFRPSISEWWSERPTLGFMALGVFWWICLSPSLIGLAMIVWGAYRLLNGSAAWSVPGSSSDPTSVTT